LTVAVIRARRSLSRNTKTYIAHWMKRLTVCRLSEGCNVLVRRCTLGGLELVDLSGIEWRLRPYTSTLCLFARVSWVLGD